MDKLIKKWKTNRTSRKFWELPQKAMEKMNERKNNGKNQQCNKSVPFTK